MDVNEFHSGVLKYLEDEEVDRITYMFRHTFEFKHQDIDSYVRFSKMVCKYAMGFTDSPKMINSFIALCQKFCGFSKDTIALHEGESVKHLYDNVYSRVKEAEAKARISLENDYEILKTDEDIRDAYMGEAPTRVLYSTGGSLEEFKQYVLHMLMEDMNSLRIDINRVGLSYVNNKGYCIEAAVAFNGLAQTLVYAINCYSNRPGNEFLPYDWLVINSGLGDVDRILERCNQMEVR